MTCDLLSSPWVTRPSFWPPFCSTVKMDGLFIPRPSQWLEFMAAFPGYTFNLIMAHILFWIYGVAIGGIKYGYSNDLLQSEHGAILSGPSGSGSFPVLLFVVILATCMFVIRLVNCHIFFYLSSIIFSLRSGFPIHVLFYSLRFYSMATSVKRKKEVRARAFIKCAGLPCNSLLKDDVSSGNTLPFFCFFHQSLWNAECSCE